MRDGAGSLSEINRQFYDSLWARSRLLSPEHFNTWPLVRSLTAASPSRLEVAPGLNPRLPIAGTRFVDMSEAAVAKLIKAGADARVGSVEHRAPSRSHDLVVFEGDSPAWGRSSRRGSSLVVA